jgi:predicted molibdopterin-dependent oxidoreductase YjgC
VDRVNGGRLDTKDLFGWQANNSEDRLTTPLVREGGELAEASWDEAMGFYTKGQLFLEEELRTRMKQAAPKALLVAS